MMMICFYRMDGKMRRRADNKVLGSLLLIWIVHKRRVELPIDMNGHLHTQLTSK